ncbi:MAG: fimbria/pilus periplasmic chaperone [Desulfuromonadales bacterium]|nr:fimbria/pilus periplasmic chaperone [Desulfuromonadales bacterium]
MDITFKRTWRLALFIQLAIILLLIVFSSVVVAGEWRVSPTRVDFDKGSKSSVITVWNESKEILTFSTEALAWTQDDSGKDMYASTGDLVFFPKVLTIKPGESRVIRVGVRAPAVQTEKSYRLFIKEQPSKEAAKAGTVAVVMQFAIPVFSKPVQESFAGSFENVVLRDGVLSLLLRNTGNVFFRINDVNFSGKDETSREVFKHELKGWYLLTGSARDFSIDFPSEICRTIHVLEVVVNTDRGPLTRQIELNQEMCSSSQ